MMVSAASSSVSPRLRAAGVVLAGTALLAICAHVSLPLWFTPVPLTLQPFGVLLLALVLSPRLAAATMCTYLAEGALGLPVFAPSAIDAGGLVHLLGPTGGYLLAYPLAALLISWLVRRTSRGLSTALAAAAFGDLLILIGGAGWLAVCTHARISTVFSLAVLPFLPGDALKVAAAAGIATGWRSVRQKSI